MLNEVHASLQKNYHMLLFCSLAGLVEITSVTTQTISLKLAGGGQIYTISYSNTTCTYKDISNIANITEEMYTLSGLEESTKYSITVNVGLSEGGTEESNFTVTTKTAG